MKNIPLILLFTFIHYQITTFSEKKTFSKNFYMIQLTICQIGVKLYSTHFLMIDVSWYELENLSQDTWNKSAHKNNFCFSRKSFINELQFDHN